MPVEIAQDVAGLLNVADYDMVVTDVSDYVPTVQSVKQAAWQPDALHILVRHPVCAVWLQRLAASYNDNQVHYTTISARELLAQRWQTTVPDNVSDQDILASGFLAAEIAPRSGQTYQDIILEHYWGECFTFASLPLHLLGELLESIDVQRWQTNRSLPLVMQVFAERRQRWLSQAPSKNHKTLAQAVFEAPMDLRTRLGAYKTLRRYPSVLREAVLGDWNEVFERAKVNPEPIALDGLDLSAAIQEIRYYLNGLASQVKTPEALTHVLDQMSGYLREEFAWVQQCLAANAPTWPVTPNLLKQIGTRFQPIMEDIADEIAALRAAIPPAYPQDPTHNQTAQAWIEWAVQSYLPYRFWLEENDRWDATVADYAGQYADWFFAHYTELKYQEQSRWVFDLLNRVLLHLKKGTKVLFIVVDNLAFKHVGYLREQFARRGFHIQGDLEPVWAVIPTTTEVSKHCLVGGVREPVDIQGHNYEEILAKNWQGHFDGYQIAYTSVLSDLKKRPHFDANILLLNYLPIDAVLHQDERQIGTTHTRQIQAHLADLVEVICQFARRTEVEQELTVVIASDHGSTKVLADSEDWLDDKFYKQQATNRHHRYITVSDNRAANPTAYDQSHCYILPAKTFGTRDSYFIPRGYGLFVKTNESIYVHGGLTPEETIVPFMQLAKAEIQVQQPTFRLTDKVIRYAVKQSLALSIGNPNDYDMQMLELRFTESTTAGITFVHIPAGTSIQVSLPVRIPRQSSGGDLTAITLQGTFEIQGQTHPIEPVALPVEVRSLMESKTDFDFDF
ncbi:MAG: PglZ domain-containing protein [Anaerolineae bacterium]|nr:PglZ domain-containing protein [Anaerolineae bacterium]